MSVHLCQLKFWQYLWKCMYCSLLQCMYIWKHFEYPSFLAHNFYLKNFLHSLFNPPRNWFVRVGTHFTRASKSYWNRTSEWMDNNMYIDNRYDNITSKNSARLLSRLLKCKRGWKRQIGNAPSWQSLSSYPAYHARRENCFVESSAKSPSKDSLYP